MIEYVWIYTLESHTPPREMLCTQCLLLPSIIDQLFFFCYDRPPHMNSEKGPLIKTAAGLCLSDRIALYWPHPSPKQDTCFFWHCLFMLGCLFPVFHHTCLFVSFILRFSAVSSPQFLPPRQMSARFLYKNKMRPRLGDCLQPIGFHTVLFGNKVW